MRLEVLWTLLVKVSERVQKNLISLLLEELNEAVSLELQKHESYPSRCS